MIKMKPCEYHKIFSSIQPDTVKMSSDVPITEMDALDEYIAEQSDVMEKVYVNDKPFIHFKNGLVYGKDIYVCDMRNNLRSLAESSIVVRQKKYKLPEYLKKVGYDYGTKIPEEVTESVEPTQEQTEEPVTEAKSVKLGRQKFKPMSIKQLQYAADRLMKSQDANVVRYGQTLKESADEGFSDVMKYLSNVNLILFIGGESLATCMPYIVSSILIIKQDNPEMMVIPELKKQRSIIKSKLKPKDDNLRLYTEFITQVIDDDLRYTRESFEIPEEFYPLFEFDDMGDDDNRESVTEAKKKDEEENDDETEDTDKEDGDDSEESNTEEEEPQEDDPEEPEEEEPYNEDFGDEGPTDYTEEVEDDEEPEEEEPVKEEKPLRKIRYSEEFGKNGPKDYTEDIEDDEEEPAEESEPEEPEDIEIPEEPPTEDNTEEDIPQEDNTQPDEESQEEEPDQYNEDFGEDGPTDYTQDEDVEDQPEEEPQEDTPTEEPNTTDTHPDDTTQPDSTQNTDTTDNQPQEDNTLDNNEESQQDDNGLEDGPTDYDATAGVDGDTTTDDGSDTTGDTNEEGGDAGEDTTADPNGETPAENSNGNDRDIAIKNYNIRIKFRKLVESISEILQNLSIVMYHNPIQNQVLERGIENIQSIKEQIISYMEFNLSSDYKTNLYYYTTFIQALQLNLDMLTKNSQMSMEDTKNNK